MSIEGSKTQHKKNTHRVVQIRQENTTPKSSGCTTTTTQKKKRRKDEFRAMFCKNYPHKVSTQHNAMWTIIETYPQLPSTHTPRKTTDGTVFVGKGGIFKKGVKMTSSIFMPSCHLKIISNYSPYLQKIKKTVLASFPAPTPLPKTLIHTL